MDNQSSQSDLAFSMDLGCNLCMSDMVILRGRSMFRED